MRQQEVFNKIGVILKELNDQYKYLEANPDDMNSLELELFVANAHFLADHAEIIKKLNLQTATAKPALPPPPKETPKTEEKFFEPVVRQPVKPQKPIVIDEEEIPVINFEITPTREEEPVVTPQPEIIRHELDVEPIEDVDEEVVEEIENWEEEDVEELKTEDQPAAAPIVVAEKPFIPELKEEEPIAPEPEVIPEPPAVKAPEPPVYVAPVKTEPVKEKEEVLTINQRMSAQLNKGGVTDQPAGQPVSDLKHAISLNDKLLYIKDLFNGYNLAYSEAIEILNRLSSFEDAERFLSKNYVTKNNWETKPDTVAKFYAVLKRRY
ncbi:hypothetical protein [Mucilaginibacter auburnensis]|uniref:Uncharacterized protein n=1 Tax=Mucilaginibacter auburnensis TaxID=1457233 RepID=A0A2H9VNJ8_9SPHI|nr:hypothetical protein [Mucilaginibacter auburnensis]PJJ79917.1 hypothetical protein CLV57_3056 [Mucilaginibacter auburnensis]